MRGSFGRVSISENSSDERRKVMSQHPLKVSKYPTCHSDNQALCGAGSRGMADVVKAREEQLPGNWAWMSIVPSSGSDLLSMQVGTHQLDAEDRPQEL